MSKTSPVYPSLSICPRNATQVVYHDTPVPDPYAWLEEPHTAETKRWVDYQCQLYDAFISENKTKPVIEQKLLEIWNYERVSTPFKCGDDGVHLYFHNNGLQNQDVLYKLDTLDSERQVLLDPNLLSEDGTAAVSRVSCSKSGEYIAYSVSLSGSDWNTVHVRNVATGVDEADECSWVKFSGITWSHDSLGFFYSKYPAPAVFEEPQSGITKGTETQAASKQSLYYHRLGTPQSEDTLVFTGDDSWMYGASVSHDGGYLVLSVSNSCEPQNLVYIAELVGDFGALAFSPLVGEFEAEYSYVTNVGSVFYFQTNKDASNNKLVRVDIAGSPEKADAWVDVIPEDSSCVITSLSAFAGNTKLILTGMVSVCEVIQIYSLEGKFLETVELPSLGTVVSVRSRWYESDFFFKFSSFLYPGSVFHYTEAAGAQLFKETRVGIDLAGLKTEQVYYKSKDGTQIPMFIIAKEGVERNGDNPTLLYGYGGFHISLTPSFSILRVMFVKHFGGVVAVANLRGGGEFGKKWHDAGKLLNKQNVFDDFHAAAEYLIAEKYTRSSRLCINGGSNGGLLVAACINQRPTLYGCAVSQVPVTDMLKFHKFTIGYAWCSDYGNAEENKEDFDFLRSYSPILNVNEKGVYPWTLITTSDHDDRVSPLHSYKYIAALQYQVGRKEEQKNPLLIRIGRKAGHGAGKPLKKIIEEYSEVYAFISQAIGAEWRDA